MKLWTVIIILKIVYEIVKAVQGKKTTAVTAKDQQARTADPAAYTIRSEYLYRI